MPVLRTSLAVEPGERHESIAVAVAKLEEIPEVAELRKLTPSEERVREAAERERQRRRFLWSIGGLMVGWPVVIVVLVMWWWPQRGPSEESRQVDESKVEPKVRTDVRVAIGLARAGRPFEAWYEFQRSNEQREGRVTVDQALDLAEELLRAAPALRIQQRRDACDAAEYVIMWAIFQLRYVEWGETAHNRAVGLRELLEEVDLAVEAVDSAVLVESSPIADR
ncbi:MAG: hypothetical protein HC927_10785 [Deltaproteobacteria bacterium]|nr:hypothetical protein [Deltaproteobacteria bacterium]